MRFKKWHFAIFAIFLISVSGQISWSKSKEQKPNIDWGIGIICRSDNNYESDKTSFPDKRIAVYDTPRGTLLGTIGRVTTKQEDRFSLDFQRKEHKPIDVTGADKVEIVYEGNVLKYYKEDQEYVNVLTQTQPEGVWIRKADLIANKFKAQSWLKFLTSRGNWEYHYKYNNVELKKSPNPTSETITTIKGDLFHIIFTGKKDGPWAEVMINRYDKHPLMEDGKIVEKLSGWIRAVDDNGKPLIWFYTRGM